MKSREKKIIDDFSLFNSWEEKYEYLIDLGYEMPALDANLKIDQNLIHGCQSRVWLYCEKRAGRLYFYGDSDALITKGVVALIVQFYSGLEPREVLDCDESIFDKIKLRQHLSISRANGLGLMLKKIKKHALNS